MWNEAPRLGLVAVYAPLEVGWQDAPRLIAEAESALSGLDVDLKPYHKPVFDTATALDAASALVHAKVDAVVWLAATWAFDSVALEFLRVCHVPLLAWGVPGVESGSLCGSQQLVEVLTELGMPRGFVHAPVDSPQAHRAIVDFARAAAATQRLKRARFGMLGHRTVGMTEVTFHEYDLVEQFGSLVYYQGIDALRGAMDGIDSGDAAQVWTAFKARCGKCHVDDACGVTAMQCHEALRAWIERDRLHGVAVGCYPDLMGIVCLGCGLLAEQGIVTSCEGDMNSLVLTAAMHAMSGRPVHNTDLLHVGHEDNTCTLSHCGNSALSLAAAPADIALDHVRLMDRGVVSLYPGAPGRVTMANLCGRKGSYRLAVYTGEAVPTDMVFPGIPVKVRLDVSVDDFLRETARHGAGHHWMIAYADLGAALRSFAQMTSLKVADVQGQYPRGR